MVYTPGTNADLVTAVNDWITNSRSNVNVSATYGYIGTWNLINVTSMTDLFKNKITSATINTNLVDISGWNVSNVTSMNFTFYGCSFFNCDLNKWNTTKVTIFTSTFERCTRFNGDVSDWNTSNALNMQAMFYSNSNFNRDISRWDVRKVTTFAYMFFNCPIFNADLSDWQPASAIPVYQVNGYICVVTMFYGCTLFSRDLRNWDVRNVRDNVVSNVTYTKDSGIRDFNTLAPLLQTNVPIWGTWPRLAKLSSLVFNDTVSLSPITLSPAFSTDYSAATSYTYTATFVASAVLPYTVTLTPTAYSASSTITVNGNSVTSGSPINLVFSIGSINTITIVLVNGSNTCTYIVTFPSLLSKSTTVLSALNTVNSTSTQRIQMNLDNTTLTAPIVQYVQDISQNALGYTSNAVTQRFIFGSCVPNNPLELNSTVNAGGSTITSSVKASNFLMYSDVRLKQNIEGLSETQGIDNIRAVQYNNKNDDSKHFGVIAQELAEIYPELVHSDEKNMQSVSYIELIPICINEIQLLKKRQDALQLRLNTVRSRMIQLKN